MMSGAHEKSDFFHGLPITYDTERHICKNVFKMTAHVLYKKGLQTKDTIDV